MEMVIHPAFGFGSRTDRSDDSPAFENLTGKYIEILVEITVACDSTIGMED